MPSLYKTNQSNSRTTDLTGVHAILGVELNA